MKRAPPRSRRWIALSTCLIVLPGCAPWGDPTLSDVCQVETVGDVFGATGNFDTPEEAVASVVEDARDYRRVGSEAGRDLFAGPGDPPIQVIELEHGEDGWSVFAVNTCRR